jgi:hypothetical protein
VIGNGDEIPEIAADPSRAIERAVEGVAGEGRGIVRVAQDLAVRAPHRGSVTDDRGGVAPAVVTKIAIPCPQNR